MNPHEHPLYDNRIGEMCTFCDSLETFDTFDGVRVCRYCGKHERIPPRPVNMITNVLRKQHERLEAAKRKVEAQFTAAEITKFVNNFYGYES